MRGTKKTCDARVGLASEGCGPHHTGIAVNLDKPRAAFPRRGCGAITIVELATRVAAGDW